MTPITSLDQLADEILFPSFTALEKKRDELYQPFPLDEVKERRGGKRNIDSMLRFREVFGDDLSIELARSLREAERRKVMASDTEIAAAVRNAAWKISVETENYRKASKVLPRTTPSRPISAVRARREREWLRDIPGIGFWLYEHYGGDYFLLPPVPASRAPVRVQLEEPAPTNEDRTYYADILSDSTILLLLTNPQLRKHLRQETSTGASISNIAYLREAIQRELRGALDRDILALDRGYRTKDKRTLIGLRAANAIIKTIEAFSYKVSLDSFRSIAGEHQAFMNEEIERAVGITLHDDEFKQVFELYKPRLVNHEVDVAVHNVVRPDLREAAERSVPPPGMRSEKTMIVYGGLGRTKTQLGPYLSSPAPGTPTAEDIVPLTPTMRRLKSADTVEDPVFLAALNRRLNGDTAREISRLFRQLEMLGISNGRASEAIELFFNYGQNVTEIVGINQVHRGEGDISDLITEAQVQLAPLEREEYITKYGTGLGEKVFRLAGEYVGKQTLLEQARGIARILSEEKPVSRTAPVSEKEKKLEELTEKYIALGLPPPEATALAKYEDKITDPDFNPNERQMAVVTALVRKAATDHLRRKAMNGRFDSETYATLLGRLFEGITPRFEKEDSGEKKCEYKAILDLAWKNASEDYQREFDELGQRVRSSDEETSYQIMGRLAGKAQLVHNNYSELKPGSRKR